VSIDSTSKVSVFENLTYIIFCDLVGYSQDWNLSWKMPWVLQSAHKNCYWWI